MQASPSSLKCMGDQGNFERRETGVTPFSAATVRHLLTASVFAGILSLIVVVLSGCGAPKPIRYYQLSLPSDASGRSTADDVALAARSISAPPRGDHASAAPSEVAIGSW